MKLLSCIFLLAIVAAAPASSTSLSINFSEWFTYYYLKPKPEEIPAALKELTARGYFENDDVQASFSGFFFQIFSDNPARIAEWVEPYVGIPKRHIIVSGSATTVFYPVRG